MGRSFRHRSRCSILVLLYQGQRKAGSCALGQLLAGAGRGGNIQQPCIWQVQVADVGPLSGCSPSDGHELVVGHLPFVLVAHLLQDLQARQEYRCKEQDVYPCVSPPPTPPPPPLVLPVCTLLTALGITYQGTEPTVAAG